MINETGAVEMYVVSSSISFILKNSQSAGTVHLGFSTGFKTINLHYYPQLTVLNKNMNFAAARPNSVSDVLK